MTRMLPVGMALFAMAGCIGPRAVVREFIPPDPCGLEAVICAGEMIPPSGDVVVGPLRRCRTQVAITTAYNYVREQTDKTPCRAANGEDVCRLHEVGDRSCAATYQFGTRVMVPEFGACTVRDRLSPGQRKPWRIDLGFGGRDEIPNALRWGRRHQTVVVCENSVRPSGW